MIPFPIIPPPYRRARRRINRPLALTLAALVLFWAGVVALILS